MYCTSDSIRKRPFGLSLGPLRCVKRKTCVLPDFLTWMRAFAQIGGRRLGDAAASRVRALHPAHMSSTAYVSPWSDAVLTRLREKQPAWFSDDAVELRADGTFETPIVGSSGGRIATMYDSETRSHFMDVHIAADAVAGRALLFDGSKNSYLATLDFSKVIDIVDEMCDHIDAAAARDD